MFEINQFLVGTMRLYIVESTSRYVGPSVRSDRSISDRVCGHWPFLNRSFVVSRLSVGKS